MFSSLFVVIVGVCYCSKENNTVFLGQPQLSGPSVALVKQPENFKCELPSYPQNEIVLFQLLKNHESWLSESTSLAGEAVTFSLVIKTSHEGNLECVARLQSDNSTVLGVSKLHYLKVIEPVKTASVSIQTNKEEFFEGTPLKLRCHLDNGTHVSYKWKLNEHYISPSLNHNFIHDSLIIKRPTSKDSGYYMCNATNNFNGTDYQAVSSGVYIKVKDRVSNPEISFIVLKEVSQNYSAVVTCNSTRGTPPISFSLYKDKNLFASVKSEVADATFKVPLVLGQHMGWLQCHASNGNETAHSRRLPLEVVPVHEPVMLHYDYDMGENHAVIHVRYYCRAAKGSHPRYQWFLNDSLLHDRGSFYYVVNQPPEQSVLELSVRRSSAGTYRCEVSDSFDNITYFSSNKQYMDKEVINRLPVLVVAVVFGCFIFLILLVSVCCWIGLVFRRRQFGDISMLGLDTWKRGPAYEGELDLLRYNEDDDLVKTVTGDEFDQASEVSLDEWPQIMEEKKTLENSPVEFF